MKELVLDKSAGQRFLWFDENENSYEALRVAVPRFYDYIYEMQEIYKAEARMLNKVKTAFEIALNNMFIDYMDEESVSQLEEFLSIVPYANSSLNDRKLVLINHFRGYGKISAEVITETSKYYNLKADTRFDEQDENGNFFLRIKLNVPNGTGSISDYVENIKILDIRLPAHLKKIYEICFKSSSDVGLAFISVFTYHFTHNCNEADLSELPDVLGDDAGNLLLDDYGNVFINEEKESDT